MCTAASAASKQEQHENTEAIEEGTHTHTNPPPNSKLLLLFSPPRYVSVMPRRGDPKMEREKDIVRPERRKRPSYGSGEGNGKEQKRKISAL